MKKKVGIVVLLLFVIGGIFYMSTSYGLFQKQMEVSDVTLKVGELQYSIVSEELTDNQMLISSYSSKEVNLEFMSNNPIDTKYELYYKIISPSDVGDTVDGGYLGISDNPASGIIGVNEKKNIKLIFNNASGEEVLIEIGVQAGLVHNELVLDEEEKSLKEEDIQKYYVYDYTGDVQSFTTPKDGTYKIELWGGGTERKVDNYGGGYVSGIIDLNQNELLYIYIGGVGKKATDKLGTTGGGYNGGGNAGYYSGYSYKDYTFGGGGATDIRLVEGPWDDSLSLCSRIMIAAGSNGGGLFGAGGLEGYGHSSYLPGTQTTGYAFGYGENTTTGNGGGSGYYGGHTSVNGSNGGGGSSFISGHAGCIAIKSETDQSPKVSTYSKIEDSYHYSGKVFTDTVMIDGRGYNWTTEIGEKIDMPTHDGLSTMVGNNGNGYARITYIKETEKEKEPSPFQ